MISKYFSAKWATIAPSMGNFLRRSALFASVFALLSSSSIHPQSAQMTGAPSPSFEVATVKPDRSRAPGIRMNVLPGRFSAQGVTTKFLVAYAYNVRDYQVAGGPSWINSEEYDIDAKNEDAVGEKLRKLPWKQYREQYGWLVQSPLVDRFKLSVRHETRELPVYELVVAKNGPHLTPSPVPPPGPEPKRGPGMRISRGQLTATETSLGELADILSRQPELGDRNVLDQSGIEGKFDISLHWMPDQSPPAMPMGPAAGNPRPDSAPPPDTSGPSIFTALQEQLGLKLESTKGPVEVLVIDHVEKPSEN